MLLKDEQQEGISLWIGKIQINEADDKHVKEVICIEIVEVYIFFIEVSVVHL